MAARAKSIQLREIGKVEAVPALFNINEPFLFGLPVVYNVNLFVPFIGVPMDTTIVAYILHAIGFTTDIRVQQPCPTRCLFMKRFDPKTYKKEQEEAKEMPMLN